jgi:hypothetical protein
MTPENVDIIGEGSVEFSERWRRDLLRFWAGAQAVIIQHCSNPEARKGFKKIQKITLDQKRGSRMPEESIDDVVEALAESIYGWLKIKVEEGSILDDVPVHFAIEVQRLVSKDSPPSRNKFYVSAAFAGGQDDIYDSAENEALSEIERHRQALIEQQQKTIDQQSVHIENLNEALIKLATIAHAPMETVTDYLRMGNHIAMQGFQSQVNASKMQFDIEAIKVQEREKSKRHEYWMESAGKYVLPYIPNAVMSVMANLKGQSPKMPDPHESPPSDASGPDDADDSDSKTDAETYDKEWGERFAEFKASLTGEQTEAINDSMTRQEQSAFWKVVSAPSFTAAIAPYQALCDIADFGALVGTLREHFSPTQQKLLWDFHTEYCQYLEAVEEMSKTQKAGEPSTGTPAGTAEE